MTTHTSRINAHPVYMCRNAERHNNSLDTVRRNLSGSYNQLRDRRTRQATCPVVPDGHYPKKSSSFQLFLKSIFTKRNQLLGHCHCYCTPTTPCAQCLALYCTGQCTVQSNGSESTTIQVQHFLNIIILRHLTVILKTLWKI